ncbi:MAG: single-stranded DNA-binding protein [Patescibacteria group bacterium]
MDLNKVMLIGRLTRDPESRTTPQGVTVCNFSLATSRTWKDDQGNTQDRTEFHNIVAWRRLGEICAQYLAKGRQIYLEGHLETRNWEDQNGQKRYRTEVIADNMIMLGNKGDSTKSAGADRGASSDQPVEEKREPAMVAAPAAGVADEEIRIEDIPF